MKKVISLLLFYFCLTATLCAQHEYALVTNNSFGRGEELQYQVKFGIFYVGKATTRISEKAYYVSGRKCYKIDALGETANWVSWITKVRDQWGAYVDSAALVTHVSYRKIREGRYKKDEWISFDHNKDSAAVKTVDYETGKYTTPKYYKTPDNVRDLVAGFMYIRVLDLAHSQKGDTLMISGFFEDTSYDLPILYDGMETIKNSIGKVKCHRLIPIMPDNKLFDGENSITCWISADSNQIPAKIYAKMFVGGLGLELLSYKGLKGPLNLVN